MDQTLNTLIYSALAGASTLLGIFLVLRLQKKITSRTTLFVSFAAGVLLTAAFVNIIPQSLEFNPNSLIYVLISMMALYTLEQRLTFHTCHEEDCDVHQHQSRGLVGMMGIGFHSLLDGIIIGVGFEAGYGIGIITTLGVLMHEFPEGISIFSILLHSGYDKRKALIYSIYVALATPLGAVLALLFINNVDTNVLGILLAIAAGTFIYIGASDLIPETHKKANNLNVPFAVLGALSIYLANLII